MKKIAVFYALALGVLTAGAQAQSILIKGGKVHTLADMGTLESADVLVVDGKVEQVAPSLNIPADRVIDAKGKVVTPGVIAPISELGLVEISAASGTNDHAVTGESIGSAFNPVPAYNPKSTLIPFNRAGGVTSAVVFPAISTWDSAAVEAQRVFAGRGFAIKLNGEFDSVEAEDVAQKAYLGEAGAQLAGGSRANAYAKIENALNEAKEYRDNRAAIRLGEWRELNYSLADLEALQPVINGTEPLLITANRASDILAAIELAKTYSVKLVLLGAAEGWMVAEQLAQAQVPVVIDAINNLPISFSSLGARLDNAALLTKAGVKVAISGPDYASTHNVYLSRQSAGNAVAHGLSYEEALKSISTNVADIFSLSGGTLEKGADADIVVWSGDPLEVTSYPEQVLIEGEPQSLVTRSTRLRDRHLKPSKGHEFGYRN
ncbi:amidohydrolase family protein [Microbulbifer variabilis]|uniref:Amidohydrolase family protein n=1 Tax=Microbulbifer variabilis TaxID=266805 RepID=A0ABY4VMI4_9GAMM|nr:amidohydrolase family protein [Microbulbifer variabilis]USD23064.1 amidohydrolase family protein [Microbulbifer variabilis]